MAKFLWLSRHKMTVEQAAIAGDMPVVEKNLVWQATADARADRRVNAAIWESLRDEAGINGIIAGVYPPVAIEAMLRWRGGIRVISPVSAQSEAVRADGSKAIEFVHIRWAQIN